MKNIPLRDRAWPAPTPQEQAEIDNDMPDEPVNILKEIEKDIASRKRAFLYSLIRRDQALALIEYVHRAEQIIAVNRGFISSAEFDEARVKLGLKDK